QATFAVTPILNYPALNAVCENVIPFSVATASVTNGINGNGVYSGPGTNAAGMFNPAAAGPGNHTITYTYTTTGGCVQSITSNILEGVYNINLQATSSNGCIKDTTIAATFSLTPLLAYTALNPICENAAPV